jgi:DNA polymerase (family 10)
MGEIVDKADKLGYEYIAFTEHNPSHSRHSESQIISLLKRKKEAVDKLNTKLKNLNTKKLKKVFNSLEVDILPGGKLPVSDAGMETLDFALVSVHSSFRQSKLDMTKRVLSALAHPKVKVFAHPTARKLTQREGIELDWDKVFEYCLKNDKWLEINCDPMRLDLPDILVKEAVKLGVKTTMGTDSHHFEHMDNMQYGISVARRGWAEKKDIINTLSLSVFERMIK